MITLKAELEQFNQMGEKTGWTYIFIPQSVANQIKPDYKRSFRVKGKLDAIAVFGMALVPMGEGDFILAVKASLRKQLKKEAGSVVSLELEEDKDFKIELPKDLELCLSDEDHLIQRFLKLPKSHQNWYINWLNTAKTEPTRTKRLVKIVSAMDKDITFSEMMREGKEPR